jgi:hypothetical protein
MGKAVLGCVMSAVGGFALFAGGCATRTALHGAAIRNDLPAMEEAMGRGSNLNARDGAGMTAAHCAALHGRVEATAFLIERGADVGAKDGESRTPLHYAVSANALDVMERLLRAHIDVNATDAAGISPLHIAAQHDHVLAANLLLDKGAHVDARDAKGFTAIHHAARYGAFGVAKLLADSNAELRSRGEGRFTPLGLALRQNDQKMAALIRTVIGDQQARDRRVFVKPDWPFTIDVSGLSVEESAAGRGFLDGIKRDLARCRWVKSVGPAAGDFALSGTCRAYGDKLRVNCELSSTAVRRLCMTVVEEGPASDSDKLAHKVSNEVAKALSDLRKTGEPASH